MQKKYGKDGLVAISVSLDDTKDRPVMAKVKSFLEKQHATFTNVVLNEDSDVWQSKFKIFGPPCVFVFDRTGKWKKFAEPVDYAEVEKDAVAMLKSNGSGK